MEQMALDSILSDEAPKVEAPAPEPVKEAASEPVKESPPVEKEEKPRDETGKFAKKEEITKEVKSEVKEKPVREEMSDKEKALLAAAQDERRKRQELEHRLKALEEAKPKEPEKTFWDDPENALNKFKQEMQNQIVSTRLNTSEAIARSRHTDFDENMEVFKDVVTKTPGLYQEVLAAADPAEFAYNLGKTHKELRDVGSIDNLKAKLEKEIRLKLEVELKEREEKLRKDREALPGTLSDARGTTQNAAVWNGPTPLDDILH